MRLLTIRLGDEELAALGLPQGAVTLATINREARTDWPTDTLELLRSGRLAALRSWLAEEGTARLLAGLPAAEEGGFAAAPLLRRPRKIWGMGFNYVASAEDLAKVDPSEEPVGFLKPDTSLIGPGDPILLSEGAGRITAEAELAIVIGAECRNVSEAEAPQYVAGFAATLDMTAADIHARNPEVPDPGEELRHLLSLGSELVSPDELGSVLDLKVHTALNGEVRHANSIFNMRYRPWFAVAFHSRFMTLLPGDILLTGTPGAVDIRAGDVAECRIDGFEPLRNPVR